MATIDGVQDFRQDFVYDRLNRQTSVRQYGQTGNAVSDKRVDFAYDAIGQFDMLTRYANLAGVNQLSLSDYEYDAAGRLTALVHSADLEITYLWHYDEANRLTSYSRAVPGSVEDQTYQYDEAGQLTVAAGDVDIQSFAYDGNGNRTNGNNVTASGSDNRQSTDGTYDYAYDDEGNLVLRYDAAGHARVFSYDYRNRLTEVRDYTGYVNSSNPGTLVQHTEFTYDVNNLRIAKTVDLDGDGTQQQPETTRWALDGQHEILEFAGGVLAHRYLYGPQVDQILADEALGETSSAVWILPDNLGSVRDVHDSNGDIVASARYNSFGRPLDALPIRFGYTGRDWDAELALQYNRARYYDPVVGRWLSQDPIGFDGDPSNLYRYVGNNPVVQLDPFGRKKLWANGYPVKVEENEDAAWHVGEGGLDLSLISNQFGQPAAQATGQFSYSTNSVTSYLKLFGSSFVCNTITGSVNDKGGSMFLYLDNFSQGRNQPLPYRPGLFQIHVQLKVRAQVNGCGGSALASGRMSPGGVSALAESYNAISPTVTADTEERELSIVRRIGGGAQAIKLLDYTTLAIQSGFLKPGTSEVWGTVTIKKIMRIGR